MYVYGQSPRAAFDGDVAAVAELVDVVLDAPAAARLAHEIGAHLGGDDLVRAAAAVASGMPSKLTIIPSPIESKVPSLPHMHTDAVTIRLQNALAWLVMCQAWRIGAV